MKVLFILQYPGYLRYFDSALEALSQRGHQVAVAFDQPHKQTEGLAALQSMDATVENLGQAPRRYDIWRPVARGLRGTIDYARYLHPRFKESSYLRDRMRQVLPPLTRMLGRWTTTTAARTERLVRALQACERAVPSSAVIEAWLRGIDPDALIVSPLVTDQSPQVDMIKAARRVGVRSALCVASWDHLTTKGLMRIQPDLVALWNHAQRREAIELHGTQADRIVVTGAHCFDRWFDRTPRRTRDDFCARVGLRSDRPFVVFVGSTFSISSPAAEVQYVTRWINAVRNGPGSLADVGILIRPHPYNSLHWGAVDLSQFSDVAVYPRHGANPVDTDDRADYYDTLHHGAAIVGINTSAMIEAGIQNRPVFTIVDASFDDTQTGTLHFRYLLPENGGHLQHAASLDEHTRQLSATIDGGTAPSAQAFITAFVRPHGLDVPATPRLVETLEQLADRPLRTAAPLPLHLWPLRAGLWTLAVWLRLIDLNYWRRLLLRLRTGLRNRLRLWRHYKTLRTLFRESSPRRVLKRLSQRRYRYEMALWQFYKTKRKSLREWRARRSGAGGAAL